MAATLIVDRSGDLARYLGQPVRPAPERDTRGRVEVRPMEGEGVVASILRQYPMTGTWFSVERPVSARRSHGPRAAWFDTA